MELVDNYNKQLDEEDIFWIEELIVTKSWWDTVNYLATNLAGEYLKKYKNKINSITYNCNASENILLQRSSLLF